MKIRPARRRRQVEESLGLFKQDGGGLPIGLFESAKYTDTQVHLRPGDVLACFSDGITEATDRDGEVWDESEIKKVLHDNRNRSAAELVEKLVQGADGHMGAAEQN